MALWVIRHPPVDVPRGLCYGRGEVPLVRGWEVLVAPLVAALPPLDHLVSSPAKRCRALADALGAAAGMAVREDERLRELDFGRWEMQRWEALPRAETEQWIADIVNAAPPGGESFLELARRTDQALAARVAGEQTLWVTHAGVIRALWARTRGEELRRALDLDVPHLSLWRMAEAATLEPVEALAFDP